MDWQPGQGPDPVRVSGGVIEAYARGLRDMGAWERVTASLAPEPLKLLEQPPLAITMVESYLVDPIIDAVSRTLGDEATVELGARAVRQSLMKYLAPLIRGTLQLVGATPAALLSHLTYISRLNVSGVGLSWKELSETSGELLITYPRPTLAANFLIWRGSISVVFELCNTLGAVSAPHVNAERTRCTLPVRWDPGGPGR